MRIWIMIRKKRRSPDFMKKLISRTNGKTLIIIRNLRRKDMWNGELNSFKTD